MVPWIISCDDHLIEPPDLFEGRLPARFTEDGPRVVRLPWERGPGFRQHFRPAASGPEADFWVVGEIQAGVLRVEGAAGLPAAGESGGNPMNYEDMRPGCYRVKERLEDMDMNRVERSLCFPNVCRFAGQLFLWLADKDLAWACVRAYNDWVVEEWAGESGGRLIPLGMIPLWDPILAAQEVRRNAARGVRAVTFSELPSELGLPSIHDHGGHWIPFIEACDETGTVICIHIGSSSTIPESSPDMPALARMSTLSFHSQLAFTDWMSSGLLARYKQLKLAFSESQIGWMPYTLERLDRVWKDGSAPIDPAMDREPSSYMAGRVYGCFFEDDFGIEVRHAIGIDQITFEADYPHMSGTWPHTYDYLSEAVAGVPDEDVYKIARGNAIAMLDLEPEVANSTAGGF